MISKRENRRNVRELLEEMGRRTRYDQCGKDCLQMKSGIKHSLRCKLYVTVGSRWKEVDPRINRIVEVVKIIGDAVHIKTIVREFAGDKKVPERVTVANLKRFNGSSRGYRILGGKCHACQIKLGGVVPKSGHRGITVSLGTCGMCLDPNATLVPSCDYNWPKQGRKAVLD